MWKILLKYWRPRLARKLGLRITDAEELAVLLRAIDHKIADRSHYPDWGREKFLKQLPNSARVLDVGCGNNSPILTKEILPDCYYVGLDIGDYNQSNTSLADEYIITTPSLFSQKISEFKSDFDAVISSHNLEHCDDRDGVLTNMLQSVKPGGMLYLAFPSSDSLTFPSRQGTLNYFDDLTHQGFPPDFGKTISTIASSDFEIVYAASRYQPAIRWLIGLYHEAKSVALNHVDTETQAFWGLECVIWARKKT
jgi:SAM-dependent methyltransferase